MNKLTAITEAFKTYKNPYTYLHSHFSRKEYPYLLKTKTGDIFLVENDTDRLLVNESYLVKPYLKYFPIEEGDVVYDVGANIGTFAIFASNMQGKITAFEPCKNTFLKLQVNKHLSKAFNLKCHNVALGKNPGKGFLAYGNSAVEHYMADRTKLADSHKGRGEEVIIDRLSDYITDDIDFLKIDTEGGEYEILESLSNRDFRKIKKVALELHPSPGHVYADAFNLLRSKGYDVILEKDMLYARR